MSLKRGDLERMLSDVLEIPIYYDWTKKKSTGRRIVQALLDTMAKALQNGESVSIPGIGLFTVKTTKARKRSVLGVAYKAKTFTKTRYTVKVKPKKYVHFRPCVSIRRSLDEQS